MPFVTILLDLPVFCSGGKNCIILSSKGLSINCRFGIRIAYVRDNGQIIDEGLLIII